jgi:hypothetical protein
VIDQLFAECVLPGCRELVAAAGEVGPDCLAAFGPLLRQVPDAEPLTIEQIQDRDQAIAQIYQDRRRPATMGGSGRPTSCAGCASSAAAAPAPIKDGNAGTV